MEKGTFTDIRDGHIYKTVEIGKQVWMAENLNYYAEGLRVYKKYGNDCKYGDMYGLLYDWDTAIKVCPSGWHLPSIEEWLELIGFAGEEKAGKELKAKNGWNNFEGKSGNGEDAYGFAALPGGCFNPIKGFCSAGDIGFWWSSSEVHANRALYCYMGSDGESVGRYGYSKMYLYSARCVKD